MKKTTHKGLSFILSAVIMLSVMVFSAPAHASSYSWLYYPYAEGFVDEYMEIVPYASDGYKRWFYIDQGSLPGGLELDNVSGIISGTPDETGVFELTVCMYHFVEHPDIGLYMAHEYSDFVITIVGELYLSYYPHPGVVGEEYRSNPSTNATGLRWTHAFEVAEGELPPGLYLDTWYGSIWGTPTEAGVFEFVIEYRNTQFGWARSEPTTLTVHASPSNNYYFYYPEEIFFTKQMNSVFPESNFDISGGTFWVVSGELPDGVILLQDSGGIGGYPTEVGEFWSTIGFEHEFYGYIETEIVIYVAEYAYLHYDDAYGVVGECLSIEPSSYGGYSPVGKGRRAFSIISGELPDGLDFDMYNGWIGGIPTESGVFNITVSLHVENAGWAESEFTITVATAPKFYYNDDPSIQLFPDRRNWNPTLNPGGVSAFEISNPNPNASITFPFYGTGIEYKGVKNVNRGKFDVTVKDINGNVVYQEIGDASLSNPPIQRGQVLYRVNDLSLGEYTIIVKTHGAPGTLLGLDAFYVF